MTTEELCAEIERLDAAATAGPWTTKEESADEWWFDMGCVCIEPLHAPLGLYRDSARNAEVEANAELIASYRTLAVEAAKKLREMQERCTELEDSLFGKEAAR